MKKNNKENTLNNYSKTDKDELINKLYKNKYELEEKNEELYQVINEKNKQLKEIDKYNYEDKDIISTLIMENEEIKKENKSLKEKNKQLQDYKEEMINSRSWKITKPLRNISQKVSKKN